MASQQRSLLSRLVAPLRWLWLAMTIAVAVATIISANSGAINPDKSSWPALFAMTFPILIIANVALGLVNLFINKKVAIAQWIALLCSIPAINDWFPVNLSAKDADADDTILRLMSYNTYGFVDAEECYPDDTNRTASAIIHSGADIICLQEVGMIVDMPRRSLYDAQVDSINDIYPYFISKEEKMVSILSKYPLKAIDLPQPDSPYSGWQAAETVIGNDTILIVSLHLQSFGLNEDDKIVYHQFTEGDVSRDMKGAGIALYRKLAGAFRLRALQAQMLRHQIDSLGYNNIVVSGDFNDIAGCYAMRTICGDDMRSVHHDIATGPVITYHSDRFLFNIDHVLYKGNIAPLRYRRGNIKSSDHYPLYITFHLPH